MSDGTNMACLTWGSGYTVEVDRLRNALLKSEQEIERLRAELAEHQESSWHPDWSKLRATRDSLREHMRWLREARDENAKLRDALRRAADEPNIDKARAIADAALEEKHE
jgi:chromosome segregation ATPase